MRRQLLHPEQRPQLTLLQHTPLLLRMQLPLLLEHLRGQQGGEAVGDRALPPPPQQQQQQHKTQQHHHQVLQKAPPPLQPHQNHIPCRV
mmetsp:Transcript_16249/g.44476  ORF Transcript_16249/g.44476 Transcript_16249/m.44476 type:complete len:89 (+) Transcript_16249:593-859(+)